MSIPMNTNPTIPATAIDIHMARGTWRVASFVSSDMSAEPSKPHWE